MFIGLDSGRSLEEWYPEIAGTLAWREIVCGGYRAADPKKPENFNWHYRGCVSVASRLLNLPCKDTCHKKCALHNDADCALAHFAQTNAVKCVETKSTMTFAAHTRIAKCMPANVFAEFEILQPHAVVLQGRNLQTGHIHVDFERAIAETGTGSVEFQDDGRIGMVNWHFSTWAGKSVLLSLTHPSALGISKSHEHLENEATLVEK